MGLNVESLFLKKVFTNFNDIIVNFGEVKDRLRSQLKLANLNVYYL